MRFDPNADAASLPKRLELPSIQGAPTGAAWFWGEDDERGRLNLLTPTRVAKAAQENIKTGDVVSLDLPLKAPEPPLFGRQRLKHTFNPIGSGGAFDDVLEFNTQSSTQWDGFRHFADPKTGLFYNGVTSDDITKIDEHGKQVHTKCGIGAWGSKGIVGRGVLLDIYTWSKESYNPISAHSITLPDIKACASAQGVSFETGDILFIRMGYTKAYQAQSMAQKHALASGGHMDLKHVGLEASTEMIDFLHDNYFAAGAGDAPSFEVWPPKSLKSSLHSHMLPLWGMPIGEFFDLEALSEMCKKENRWTFLATSAPLKVDGGIGSPPNALAMF